MQFVAVFGLEGIDVEAGFLVGPANCVPRLWTQRPPLLLVVCHCQVDAFPDMAPGPVRDAAAAAHSGDDAHHVLHVLEVHVAAVLQDKELPGYAEAQVTILDVLQDEVRQFQDAQVVGQGRSLHVQIFRQLVDREVGLRDGPLVGSDNLDIGELLALDVLRKGCQRHSLVGHLLDVHVYVVAPQAALAEQPAGGDSAVAAGRLEATVVSGAGQGHLEEPELVNVVGQVLQVLEGHGLSGLPWVVVYQVERNLLSIFHAAPRWRRVRLGPSVA